MCWNKQVSIVTFILAIIGSIYLYKRNRPNDRWIAIFAATIAMIQLAEFFMWSDLACGSINKYASMFALLILALEPLMNMIGGIYFSNNNNKTILKWMLVAYLIFIGFTYFTQIYGKPRRWCGTLSAKQQVGLKSKILDPTSLCSPNSNPFKGFISDKACNLKWYFTKNINTKLGIIWILFLLVPFLTMKPRFQGIILLALGFVTYGMAHYANNAAQGSLWCWIAILIIVYKILVPT